LDASCTYTWKHWGMVNNDPEPWQLIAEGNFTGTTFEMSHFEMNQRSFHYIQLNSDSSCNE
jgi:hypothetical protein